MNNGFRIVPALDRPPFTAVGFDQHNVEGIAEAIDKILRRSAHFSVLFPPEKGYVRNQPFFFMHSHFRRSRNRNAPSACGKLIRRTDNRGGFSSASDKRNGIAVTNA